MARLYIKGFDDELLYELRTFLINVYGSIYGHLRRFVEEAVREKLEREKQKLQQQNLEELHLKVKKKHVKLLIWLYDLNEILSPDLINYIRTHIGIDKRTIKQYLDFLTNNKFIEEEKLISYPKRRGEFPTILYRVNKDRIKAVLRSIGLKIPKGIEIEREKRIRGIEITPEEKRLFELMDRITVRDVAEYAKERYEAGDSLEEIADKLEDLGFNFSKSQIRNFIRSVMKYERRN